jgi:hypothetical protein
MELIIIISLNNYRRSRVILLWVWLVRMDERRQPRYYWTTGQLSTTKIRYIPTCGHGDVMLISMVTCGGIPERSVSGSPGQCGRAH